MKLFKSLTCVFVFILILLMNKDTLGQIGIRVSLIEYTGVGGYAVKPGIGYELKYNNRKPESRYKFGAALGFYSLKPRQDTTYYLTYSSQDIVYPSYQIIEKYNVTSIRVENSFRLFKTKISPLIGLENGFSVTSVELEKFNHISSGTEIEGYLYLETMPKVELLMNTEHLEFVLGFAKCYLHSVSFKVANSYWKPYLAFSYYF